MRIKGKPLVLATIAFIVVVFVLNGFHTASTMNARQSRIAAAVTPRAGVSCFSRPAEGWALNKLPG